MQNEVAMQTSQFQNQLEGQNNAKLSGKVPLAERQSTESGTLSTPIVVAFVVKFHVVAARQLGSFSTEFFVASIC